LLQIRCRCSEAQSPLQFVIAAAQRARGIGARGIEDAPTSAYAAVVLGRGEPGNDGAIEAGRTTEQEIYLCP
jgi:hypothetical protein